MSRVKCLTVLLLALAVGPMRADEKLESAAKKVQSLLKDEKWTDAVKEIDTFLAGVAKDKTIRFDEELAPLHSVRGQCHEKLKKYKEAAADYTKAAEMDAKNPWYPLYAARILSTCPDEKVRDGKAAIKLALQGQQRMENYDPDPRELLGTTLLLEVMFVPPITLAAAYAEAGQFKDAAKTLKEFLDELKQQNPFVLQGIAGFTGGEEEFKKRVKLMQEMLGQYRESKPWRTSK
jgi:tetratricopeptide (TPR) repeat protein